MDIDLPTPGTYVVAVSGGVDSVALLHLLQQNSDYKLVVAHFDHGIREDSAEDRKLVHALAKSYKLPFVFESGQLGAGASEAAARVARYKFLQKVQAASGARALVTAHHQDDVLETAIINMLRGTGRKGLTALRNRPNLVRPLLAVPKQEVRSFAETEKLQWREDSTNQNTDYLRNYVRHRILPRFDADSRARLLQVIRDLHYTNEELDRLLTAQLNVQTEDGKLEREYALQLPHDVALEVMATWLRAHDINDFDGKTLERLVVAAKTGATGKSFDVVRGAKLLIEPEHLALTDVER